MFMRLVGPGLLILLCLSAGVLCVPQLVVPAAGQSVHLRRRSPSLHNAAEWAQWAKSQRDAVITKYQLQPNKKRGTGENLMVNEGYDSSFYGSLAIGTPPYSFDVVLDTGSSYVLKNAGYNNTLSELVLGTSGWHRPDNLNHDFKVTYNNGEATGTLVEDVVQMAGFTVSDQQFGSVTTTSSGLLRNPVTGLIGLAWKSLSSSGAMPFWQALASRGAWDSPLMAFHLTRYINASRAGDLEPGGSLTMGYVNKSLYTGNIDYQSIPNGQASYWLQEIVSMTVQGKSISLPSSYASYAAIDTGTTLVAGPASGVAAVYAQIPGSSPGTGPWEGFYSYPCATEVTVKISFGGPSWAISPADFRFQPTSSSDYCYGAFYSIPPSPGAPQWIIGDTFLKNVYSVFRYDPPSVGFAALSEIALNMNGITADIPTATLAAGTASATANAASTMTRTSSITTLFISALLSFMTVS